MDNYNNRPMAITQGDPKHSFTPTIHQETLMQTSFPIEEEDMELEITSGIKHDTEKPMWELAPYDALEEVVKVLTYGADKYAPRNWELGMKYSRLIGGVFRHLTAWTMGERKDPETGLSHLAHAACGVLFLLAYEKRGMTEWDNLPNRQKQQQQETDLEL